MSAEPADEAPSELAPGLWGWRAPHPQWRSDFDWDRLVAAWLYVHEGVAALIDPLLPAAGREELLGWLDERVAGHAVTVLTTIRWHRRDREELAARYAATTTRAWNAVPAGVVPKPLRGAGETLYWLPAVQALVAGDRLVGGSDGTLQLCPERWLANERVDRRGLAVLMRPLLELPIELALVSHGASALHDGRAALAAALREAESRAS